MERIEAIKSIIKDLTDEILITSAGMISREVFSVNDRPKTFYVQGSMGATLGIGIGIALNKPNEEIVVIAGDGEVLMNVDTLILLKKLQKEDKIKNLCLFILDNNKYQSTGGQPTISNAIDFRCICGCFVVFCSDSKIKVPRINISHVEIKERFMNAIG